MVAMVEVTGEGGGYGGDGGGGDGGPASERATLSWGAVSASDCFSSPRACKQLINESLNVTVRICNTHL